MAEHTPAVRHVVCTICTPDYLDRLLVLGESVAEHMAGADFRALVLQDCTDLSGVQARLDGYAGTSDAASRHRALHLDDVEWGDFDPAVASGIYSVLEFATSVKPAFLRSLLRDGWDRVTYLDPDTVVYDDFSALLDEDAPVSLTPHFTNDIPRDGHRPTTYDVLMAGVFNLGFVSVRPEAGPFLDWWSARLQFECLNDHLRGLFTDQKLVDLAHLRSPIQVVDHPGVNVAYWNLHERRVFARDDGWQVESAGQRHRLHLFHFSGFAAGPGATLSVHSTRRHVGDAVPRGFVADYERRLAATDEGGVTFTLGGSSTESPAPREWARALRADLEVFVRAGWALQDVLANVYAPRDPLAWGACPSCGDDHGGFGARASALRAGWACHASLVGVPNGVEAFFRGDDRSHRASPHAQLAWAETGLRAAVSGAPDLAAEVRRAAAVAREPADLTILGYLSGPTGVGRIGRWALATADSVGLRAAIDRVFAFEDHPSYLASLLARDNPLAAANASVLAAVNADQWAPHVVEPGRINPRIQHVEAVWAWELEDVPRVMLDAATSGGLSRVHALSEWSATAMARVLPVPVSRFTPVDLELVDRLETWSEGGPPPVGGPYVLATLDAKSDVARKNLDGVLRVWSRVAADFPDHRLVVKSADLRELAPPSLLDALDAAPRVTLADRYLDDADYFDLLAHCAAFVSLHRSEGLGLAPIEAGLCGRPVVYTDYGGVAEFLEGGFYPVRHTMTTVGESARAGGAYDPGARWAEPDLGDAVRQLRLALTTNPDERDAALAVDRKQLVENLRVAQAEAVTTLERLADTARRNVASAMSLAEGLDGLVAAEPAEEAPPVANRAAFALGYGLWALYKLLPRPWRRQANLVVAELRETRSHH